MADPDPLVADLVALRRYIEFPPTPNFAPMFRARLVSRSSRGPKVLALGLAAALVLTVGAFTAVNAGWVSLPHVKVQTTTHPPRLTPSPGGVVAQLKATGGREVSLAEARRLTDGLPVLPGALGVPDGVYVARTKDFYIVYTVYRPRAGLPATLDPQVGLLITEFTAGSGQEVVLEKLLGSAAKVTTVTVNGVPGYWIEGADHFTAPADEPAALRVSSDVLIWERSGVLIRMELSISGPAAIQLAESIPK